MRPTTFVGIVVLLALGACTEDAPQALDGEYRVAIALTSNTCDASTIGDGAPGLTTRLDLFQRTDGLYDLHWVDGWVPDAFAFSAVDLGAGGQVQQGLGGPSELTGLVTADEVDFELVHRDVRLDNGLACEKHASVRGAKRPMFDPGSVDGRYIVSVESHGGTCADGRTIQPASAWNMRMEVLPFRDDRTSVVIEDSSGGLIRFWIEPIGRGGAIRLTHDVFFSATSDEITPLDGTVEGTIVPARIDLVATFVAKNDPSACAVSYTIKGHRWIPSASSVDVEYRARYRMTDSCDPTYYVTYEQVAAAVGETGDRVDLINDVVQSTVSLEGVTITSADSSPSYSGTVAPDRTAYVVEDHYIAAGRACVFTLQVEGTARYRTP